MSRSHSQSDIQGSAEEYLLPPLPSLSHLGLDHGDGGNSHTLQLEINTSDDDHINQETAESPQLAEKSPNDSYIKVSTEETGPQPPEKSEIPRRLWLASWWWWWEIGACLISIISTVALVSMLTKINNTKLEDWILFIQPNSAVAILTTASRTAIMVPITACLSQLKWRYYRRPHQLSHMQYFDNASRGPTGSIMFLWSVNVRAFLAAAFCVVTIAALGIEPSAQQILGLQLRREVLGNTTALTGRATNYTSKVSDSHNPPMYDPSIPESPDVKIAILDAIRGTVIPPVFQCPPPASECHWGNFSTLGFCHETTTYAASPDTMTVYNISSEVLNIPWDFQAVFHFNESGQCQQDDKLTRQCPPGFDLWISYGFGVNNSAVYNSSTVLTPYPFDTSVTFFSTQLNRSNTLLVGPDNYTGIEVWTPPLNATSITWSWCERLYQNVTANQTHITSSQNTHAWLQTTYRQVDIDGQALIDVYEGNKTGTVYYISQRSPIPRVLADMLDASISATSTLGLNVGEALYYADMNTLGQDIADALTNQIRDNQGGDNYNATTVAGVAYYDAIHFKVRWAWLVLPITETVLTTILLAISIFLMWQEPLFKWSIAALLFHGLEDNTNAELPRNECLESLYDVTKDIKVVFQADKNGMLIFKRV